MRSRGSEAARNETTDIVMVCLDCDTCDVMHMLTVGLSSRSRHELHIKLRRKVHRRGGMGGEAGGGGVVTAIKKITAKFHTTFCVYCVNI